MRFNERVETEGVICKYRLKAGLDPVSCLRNPGGVGAMSAAEKLFVVFNAVPYDATAAVETGGGEGLNRALE
jgi:hypothetical protein